MKESLTSINKLVTDRKWLHANPELAYEEVNTAEYICKRLDELNITYESSIAKTGIVATIFGTATSEKAIGIRADMDALPIAEENEFPHKSTVNNVMHGCGHDGHVAILLGVAEELSSNNDFSGKVYLIFQPAEEGFSGAKMMIEEGLFDRFPMDHIFGLHNWPSLPQGVIGTLTGPIMSASYYLAIKLEGLGGHGGMPHLVSPLMSVAAQIQLALNSFVAQQMNAQSSAVVSLTKITSTDALGVLPDKVLMEGACRFLDDITANLYKERLPALVEHIAGAFGAIGTVELREVYPVTYNDEKATEIVRQAATKLGLVQEQEASGLEPSMASEDFSFMLQGCPGSYFWLGQRNVDHQASLHAPNYDFNDNVIPTGVKMFKEIALNTLK